MTYRLPTTPATMWRLLWLSALALLLSSCVPATVFEVLPATEFCHAGCRTAAAGWPVAYLLDGYASSPVGSADLVGLVLGIDRIDPARALMNWLIWLAALAALGWLGRRVRRSRGK